MRSANTPPGYVPSWDQAGFPGLKDAIEDAFKPLIVRPSGSGDRDWSRDVWKQRRRILGTLIASHLPGIRRRLVRNAPLVRKEYEPTWAKGYQSYQIKQEARAKPWTWGERHYWAHKVVAHRYRPVILSHIIGRVRPKKMLEVGCGNGLNLLLLAGRFPDVRFTGVELTCSGHTTAQQFQRANRRLPEAMQEFAPLPIRDERAFRRVEFI
jgi:hypothetical protein